MPRLGNETVAFLVGGFLIAMGFLLGLSDVTHATGVSVGIVGGLLLIGAWHAR